MNAFRTASWSALGAALLLGMPALAQGQAGAPAGVTAAVNPQASGTPPNLPSRTLEIGSDIVQNERVSTTTEGQAQLLFTDGSTVTLGPNSDLLIDNYVYDPSRKTAKLAMTVTTGIFRFVGGRASKDEPVVITTPTATIGVRGGINFTSVAPGTGATETSQAFGKDTTVTSRSTNERQSITQNGYTLTVQPNQPITISKLDIGRVNGMLAGMQGGSGKSGGASAPPNESSPAASGVASANSNQSPITVQPATLGSILGSAAPILAPTSNLASTLALASQSVQNTAQTVVSGTSTTTGAVTVINSFLSDFGSGQFNFVATAPFLRGLNFGSSTSPNVSFQLFSTIGGGTYSGFSSVIGPGSGSPQFTAIDNATGSAARNFVFDALGGIDLSANFSRSFARTTTGGSALYNYSLTFAIQRQITGGTLAEFGGDDQVKFVRIAGPSIKFTGTSTLTIGGSSLPAGVTAGTTTTSFGPETITFPLSQSLHFIAGVPATAIPGNGQFSYQLIGATSPTFTDGSGSPGKLTGTMSILFGSVPSRFYTNNQGQPIFTSYSANIPGFTVGLDLSVAMPGDATYQITTLGGAGNPSAQLSSPSGTTGVVFSQGPFGQPERFSGSPIVVASAGSRACPAGGSSCGASVLGVLLGTNASRAALAYYIGAFQGSTPGINGVAAFRR